MRWAWAASLATVALLAAVWELAPRWGVVSSTSLPPLSLVLGEAARVVADPGFADHVAASAARWLAGLSIAVLAGSLTGLAIGRSRRLRTAAEPLLTLLYPVPKVALVIPALLVLGSLMEASRAAEVARIAVIALGSVIPVVVSTHHAAAAVDPRLIWTARSGGLSPAGSLVRVVLPAALPGLLSGVRIALAASLFTLVGSELLIRETGVGAYLFDNYDIGRYERVWAMALLIAATGFVLDQLFALAVRHGLPWWEGEV